MSEPVQANPPRRREGALDWTITPAKWGAIGIMAALGAGGLGWSIVRDVAGPGVRAGAGGLGAEPMAGEGEPVGGSSRSDGDGAFESAMIGGAGGTGELYGPIAPSEAPPLRLVPIGPGGDAPRATPTPAPASGREASGADAGGGVAQMIDINTASAAELELLPGIGPSRARAIVEDRRANGAFRSVDDLDRVPGIGSATVDGLRAFATARAPS
ncbi:MAG: ComEA family DNA-binding protein [Phycisphaerales bacterium]